MRSLLLLAGSLPLAALPLCAAAQPVVLDPVILSANRAPSDPTRTGSSVSVLAGPEIEADGRPFALEQIRDLPGVTVQQSGPPGTVSGFAIRGAPQQYVRVEVDGIEISDMTAPTVSPSLSGLLVDDIGRIEVLKGSQSALYGGQAVGGVISITSPRPTGPGLENRLILEGGSYATFRGAYSLAGLSDRGEFALTAARFQTDGFSAAEEADGNSEDDGYETTRLSGTGRFYLTPQTDLFGSAFWQREDGDFDAGPGPGGDAANTFDTTSWALRGGIDFESDAGFGNLLAVSYYDLDKTQRNAFGPFITDGSRTRLEYVGTFAPAEALALQYGADYAYETSKSNFSDEESNWIAGAFVQSTLTARPDLALDAAARLDEHSEFGAFPTGRLTLAWLPDPETTLRGSLGTGFRAPSNAELYDPFSGDRDLEPETSVSADLGLARRFAENRGEASATIFWLEISDLIEFDAATNRVFQQDGKATSRGVELAARWAFSDALALSSAYTYTEAETAGGARRDRIPRHDLAIALTGAVDRVSYDLNANLVWDFYDASGIDSEGFATNYVVVNARLAYALSDKTEVYVRAANLFDEQYQTARGFSTSDRAFYAGVAARF